MIRSITLILVVGLVAALSAGCRQVSGVAETGAATPSVGAAAQPDPVAGPPGRGLGRGREGTLPRRGFGAGSGNARWGRRVVTLSRDQERAIGLTTVVTDYGPLQSRLQAVGAVYAPPSRKAVVSYPLPARVAGVVVRPGEWVRLGQPLVVLQAEEVGSAKTELFRAKAALDLATSSYDREKRLNDRGVGARKAMLAAESDLKMARSSLEAASKRLQVLGVSDEEIDETSRSGRIDSVITLHAPLTGRITDATPVIGSRVDASTEILTIVDPTMLCVDAEVYERDLARLRGGQEVSVGVPAYPGEAFRGRICYIGDVVKAETRTITVRTEIDNRTQKLKPGMFADVRLFLADEARALVLPEGAVLDNGDEKLVFVKTDEGYLPQVVHLGARQGGFVEIVRGLEAGDEVVFKGNFQLKSKLFEGVLASHVH